MTTLIANRCTCCRWTTPDRVHRPRGGPGILLINAGGFSEWFALLADGPTLDGHRVIRIIRAGYTAGSAPRGTLRGVARHPGIGHADVLAHSSGSVVALQLAVDRPELVDSLMLFEPPLIDSLAAPEDLELLRTRYGPSSALLSGPRSAEIYRQPATPS